MNKLEKSAIAALVKATREPQATAATFDSEHGYIGTHKEASRLMESDDYRKGWEACHERFKSVLQFIDSGKREDVKTWLRHQP